MAKACGRAGLPSVRAVANTTGVSSTTVASRLSTAVVPAAMTNTVASSLRGSPPLRRAIELKPSDPSPHYQLARVFEKLGNKEEAKREFETFSALKKAQPVTGGMASGPVQ